MAIAKMYSSLISKAFNGEINWATNEIKVMLCTASYTPDQDTHDYKNDVTNEVANGNGYTTGGITLTNKTMTYDADTNTWILDADDIAWEDSNMTARYAVIYNNTPATDAEKPLLGYVDFEVDKISSDGTFNILWETTDHLTHGIFKITVS